MKTKELFSIIIKIIGLIAFWKSIQTFGAMITGIGVFSMFSANNININFSYMFAIGLAMILNFVLPFLVAIIFIFKTKKVLSIIKIEEDSIIDLDINKKVFYHVLIIVFGIIFIIHGSGNFIDFDYKTETKTQYIANNTSITNQTSYDTTNQKIVSVTDSRNNNVNYFALIEIIIGLVFLIKAIDISRMISSKLDSETNETIDKT
jgi:hypothetical protein